ncbi:hypothetical protein ACN47E_001319 [Coniothyrium glycines]
MQLGTTVPDLDSLHIRFRLLHHSEYIEQARRINKTKWYKGAKSPTLMAVANIPGAIHQPLPNRSLALPADDREASPDLIADRVDHFFASLLDPTPTLWPPDPYCNISMLERLDAFTPLESSILPVAVV